MPIAKGFIFFQKSDLYHIAVYKNESFLANIGKHIKLGHLMRCNVVIITGNSN